MTNRQEQLQQATYKQHWEELYRILDSLTHSEFRRAEVALRNDILPNLSQEAFWQTYAQLLAYRPQSFITCILALPAIMKREPLNLDTVQARAVTSMVSPLHARKIISMLLPSLTTPEQIAQFFLHFRFNDEREQVRTLIQTDTPAARFMLFKTLKHIPEKRNLALNCCRHFIRKGNDQALNMASILKAYFGLHEITVVLPLNIQPYELSYLDTNYDTFCYALQGKQPKIRL